MTHEMASAVADADTWAKAAEALTPDVWEATSASGIDRASATAIFQLAWLRLADVCESLEDRDLGAWLRHAVQEETDRLLQTRRLGAGSDLAPDPVPPNLVGVAQSAYSLRLGDASQIRASREIAHDVRATSRQRTVVFEHVDSVLYLTAFQDGLGRLLGRFSGERKPQRVLVRRADDADEIVVDGDGRFQAEPFDPGPTSIAWSGPGGELVSDWVLL